MKTEMPQDPDLQKVAKLIEGIPYALLTTREADGTLHTRPMRTEAMEANGTLVFLTQGNSAKGYEIDQHPQVSVAYMSNDAVTVVAIAGSAHIRRDLEKLKALWKPLYKVWFPKGLEDPELALLEVTIDRAEYWQTPSILVSRVIGGAKALATGQPIGETSGEHQQIHVPYR
jgi:general stress protein 26